MDRRVGVAEEVADLYSGYTDPLTQGLKARTYCFVVSTAVAPESTAVPATDCSQLYSCYHTAQAQAWLDSCIALGPLHLWPNVASKFLSFYITTKSSGVRYWGEVLLAQRDQEATSRPSSLASNPARELPFHPKGCQTQRSLLTTSCLLLCPFSDSL